ncbi:MAG: hypothetical protein KDE50_02015 [Caldilineaceae bacterium]|nr:hypothetical protein [Caldilineaceae bacterium]
MPYYAGLNPLRDVLAAIYPAPGLARTVAVQAGIQEQLIEFDGPAIELWKNILSVAQSNSQLQDLINVAREHFPNNESLVEAEKVFHETPVPSLPPMTTEAPASEDSGRDGGSGDNVSISVAGNNDGIIAGRDVMHAKIQKVGDVAGDHNVIGIDTQVTVGGTPVTEEKPSHERFQQMIEELQAALDSLVKQGDLLSKVSPADPGIAHGAAESINTVVADLDNSHVNADSIKKNLSTAAKLLEGTLDRAKILAEKADAAAKAILPLVEQMTPVVAKIGLAIAWAGRLWPAL